VEARWVEEELGAMAGETFGLSLGPDGLRWVEPWCAVSARWDQVLGTALLEVDDGPTLYVLLPRRPPGPPWVEVSAGQDLAALAAAIHTRMDARGYRDAAPEHPARSPEDLLAAVLDREPVPGALEIPVGPGPRAGGALTAESLASFTAGGASLAVAASLGASWPVSAATACLGAAAVALVRARYHASMAKGRSRKRVLVLAPDGCVVGLPGGVQAFGWRSVERIATGDVDAPSPESRPDDDYLWVLGHGQLVRAKLHRDWFTRPVALVAQVAEAYRARHGRVA
jgi:hypothetical protein